MKWGSHMDAKYPSPIPGYTITETFDFYDFPILFSCTDTVGCEYLAMCAEELEDGFRWLLAAVSNPRLALIRSGKLSLREAFTAPEKGLLLEYWDYLEPGNAKWQFVDPKNLPDEDLPGEDARLSLSEGLLPEREAVPSIVAQQSRRDVIDLALLADGTHRQEIESEVLGAVLSIFQTMNYSLGDPESNRKGKIPANIKRDNQFNVVGNFHAASFGIRLESAKMANILGETTSHKTVVSLMGLLGAADERTTLDQVLKGVNPRAIVKYKLLLRVLRDNNIAVKAEWGAPNGTSAAAYLSTNQISNALQILEEKGDETIEQITVEGTLVAVDKNNGSFKLTSETESYFGNLAPELDETVFEIPSKVSALLNVKLTLHPITLEERTTYELKTIKIKA